MLSKAQIKYIQSLHQKKFRAREGAFIAEGPKIAVEVLDKVPAQVQYLAALPSWINENAAALGALPPDRVFPVEAPVLEKISALTTPHEVVLVLRVPVASPWDLPSGAWCVALDGIKDPGNLGTIIRIADWFGVSHILCSPECAEVYNPKVIQATMGSFLRVAIRYDDLAVVLDALGRPVYAATLDGVPVTGIDSPVPGVILVGNESRGLHSRLEDFATLKVTIPRIGAAESLNAAVATGILLSHFTRSGSPSRV